MISKQIKDWIKDSLGLDENTSFFVDLNDNVSFGNYFSNLALLMAKTDDQKRSPKWWADSYKEILSSKIEEISIIEKIEVAPNGFLNFFLKKEAVRDILNNTKNGKDLPSGLKGEKYFIEHTQPNPFKEFHIGHLMNNAIGESISRIVKSNGAEVKVASYHGDKGLHVAKAVWGIYQAYIYKTNEFENNLFKDPVNYSDLLKKTIEIGGGYVEGTNSYETDKKAKNEIEKINKIIYNSEKDSESKLIMRIFNWGKKVSLDYFNFIYKELDSNFDYHFFESESGEIGKKIVLQNLESEKPVFEKGENEAVIFKGEKFIPKTHTRVFLNSDGLPTYEAKEVGLAFIKKQKFDYDKSITITANEQDSFFDVVEVAIGEVMPDRKGKLKHLSHGMLKLSTGKMSSRAGNIITAEFMILDVKRRVLEKMKNRDFSDDKKNEIAEQVAIGAIKYSILKQSIGRDIIFDFDKSLSFEGDSGPYLQYGAVRANSVLKKAESLGLFSNEKIPENWQTTSLEKELIKFYEIIERACKDFAPQYIATYLIKLTGEFNSFYAKEKIIDKDDKTSSYKLFITEVFKETMQSGLWLLGINTPEEM